MYVYEFTKGKSLVGENRNLFNVTTENLVTVCLNIGKIKRTFNQFTESEEFFNKAFKFARESRQDNYLTESLYDKTHSFEVYFG